MDGTIEKNIEYECWAFTILIWRDKNVLVCSLEELKLPQFPAGFANLFQQRRSHNLMENWGMVTGGDGLRTISWPSVVAENQGQNEKFKAKISRFLTFQKKKKRILNYLYLPPKHLLIVFIRKTVRLEVQRFLFRVCHERELQWGSSMKIGGRDSKHTLRRTSGPADSSWTRTEGRGTSVGTWAHKQAKRAWKCCLRKVDKFASQSTLVYVTLREV